MVSLPYDSAPGTVGQKSGHRFFSTDRNWELQVEEKFRGGDKNAHPYLARAVWGSVTWGAVKWKLPPVRPGQNQEGGGKAPGINAGTPGSRAGAGEKDMDKVVLTERVEQDIGSSSKNPNQQKHA